MADFQGRPKMEKFPVRLKFDTINFCSIISLCIGIRRGIVDQQFLVDEFFFDTYKCRNKACTNTNMKIMLLYQTIKTKI